MAHAFIVVHLHDGPIRLAGTIHYRKTRRWNIVHLPDLNLWDGLVLVIRVPVQAIRGIRPGMAAGHFADSSGARAKEEKKAGMLERCEPVRNGRWKE